MIPLHFAAHEGYGGPSYVVSFCCGSMLVTIALWMIRFLFELYRLDGAVGKAYRALPSFHVRQMWLQGGLSGALWSAGNFFAIVSVTQLGQGVGYSSTQASMLVSGLWYVHVDIFFWVEYFILLYRYSLQNNGALHPTGASLDSKKSKEGRGFSSGFRLRALP